MKDVGGRVKPGQWTYAAAVISSMQPPLVRATGVVHAGAREVIVAGAEHEIVEGKVAGQEVGLFVVIVLVRREFRAGLRTDQEGRAMTGACRGFSRSCRTDRLRSMPGQSGSQRPSLARTVRLPASAACGLALAAIVSLIRSNR